MFEQINTAVGVLFGPLLGLNPALAVAIMAVLITFISTLFYRFLINQTKMREIKQQMTELQKKVKEVQKTNPEEAKSAMNELLKIQNVQMRQSFKPMFPTLLLVAVVLPWVASAFTGPVVQLPVSLPYFGSDFGWLMWYFVVSVSVTQGLRKVLGVE